MSRFLFFWARRRKGPKGYTLLGTTWSFDRHLDIVDQYLALDYGLSVEQTFTGRWYIYGRKWRGKP